MQAKNDLMKSFRKVATRATLAMMLTVGVIVPSINVAAQAPVAGRAAVTQTIPTPPEAGKEISTELQFTRVKDADVEALAKQYPFLAKLPQQLRDFDKEQGDEVVNPSYVRIAKYDDKANGRQLVFVHINAPTQCSYEGCPLTVYLKDAKDFREVLGVNASDPMKLVIAGKEMSMDFGGAYGVGPGTTFKYDAKQDLFDTPAVEEPAVQQQPAPGKTDAAPKQAPAPVPVPAAPVKK